MGESWILVFYFIICLKELEINFFDMFILF